jgi:hypothetical protein
VQVCGDSIAAAVAAAAPGTRVEVCPGVYQERLAIVGQDIEIVGEDATTTVIDGGGAGTVIAVTGGADVAIVGLTIRGGAAGGVTCEASTVRLRDSAMLDNVGTDGGAMRTNACTVELDGVRVEGNQADQGGGLALIDGDVEVRDSVITGNVAADHGGAIYLAADADIEDSELRGNQSGWTGGAIYVEGHAPTLRHLTIADNTTAWEGGGLYLHQSAALIADSEITGNTSVDDGGGLRVFESQARLERNRIAGNVSSDGDGGGAKISHLPSVLIDNEIVDNDAHGAGGGLELDNDSSQVHGGTIARNHSSIGGGVHVMLWTWNDGVIQGVRITDNQAWHGAGLYVQSGYHAVAVRNLLLAGNRGDKGGGIYFTPDSHEGTGAGLDVAFVVVYGNEADEGAAVWTDAPGLAMDSSILTGHEGNAVTVVRFATPTWRYTDTFPASFDGMANPTGQSGNLAVDPSLTPDFTLAAASACVDAGNPAYNDRDGSRADMGLFAGPESP